MATYKDDVVRALVHRGWTRGGEDGLYFPGTFRPHLHLRTKSGFNTYRDMVSWLQFMVVVEGLGGRTTGLVQNGREIAGAVSGLGEQEIKQEAAAVCRMKAP